MRTNIVLDDDLVKEATDLTGITTKRELIREALKTLIKEKKKKKLSNLQGRINFSPNYDYKKLRQS